MKHLVFIAAFLFAANTAQAASPCDGIWQKPLADARALLKRSAANKDFTVSPRDRIFEFMWSGDWSIVWTAPKDAEPGGVFVRDRGGKARIVNVWGGVAPKEEEKETRDWAMALDKSMPAPLARCFAWYVVEGREQGPPTRPNPFNGH